MPIGSWMIFILLNCERSRFWLGFPFLHHLTSVLSVSISSQWQHCLLIFFSIGEKSVTCLYFSVAIIPDRCNIFMAIYWWQFTGGNHPRSVHCDILTQLCFSPSIRGEAKPPLIQMINSWQQNIKYCADLRLFSPDQGFGAGVWENSFVWKKYK